MSHVWDGEKVRTDVIIGSDGVGLGRVSWVRMAYPELFHYLSLFLPRIRLMV